MRSSRLEGVSPSNPAEFRVLGALVPETSDVPYDVGDETAVQVSTGSPIPRGCDVVVKLEDTRLEGDRILIGRHIEKMKNISVKGEDIQLGATVARRGRILSAADTSVMIAVGRTRVKAIRVPRVGIMSIGNELIAFGAETTALRPPFRTVNNYANLIAGFLMELGADVRMIPIARDDPAEIESRLKTNLDELEMAITIGGSSVGVRDHTPTAFLTSGDSRMVFHGARMVPIRPVGLAMVRSKPVVILPGHAVSAALSFFTVALPVLNSVSGLPLDSRRALIPAVAQEEFHNDRPIDALFLARLERSGDGGLCASPLGWGSNIISNLSAANGFVHLGPGERIARLDVVTVEVMGSSELMRVAVAHENGRAES